MSSRARRALSGLLAAAIVFSLLEGVSSLAYVLWWTRMHYWSPLPDRLHTVYDPELGWASQKSRVAANVFGPGLNVTTNSRGLRNLTEFSKEIPPGKVRVVALGDSFTLGFGVADGDTWPAWLEKLCPQLEVPNMGQSGYGIDQSYLWYRRDGGDFDQQVLVLAFIEDDLKRVQMNNLLGYGKPVLDLIDGSLVAKNVPVARAPYLLPVLTQNLSLFEKLRLVELPRALIAKFAPQASMPTQVLSEAKAEGVDEAIFRALRQMAADRGASLLLVHLPHLASGRPAELANLPTFGTTALERVTAEGLEFADLRDEMGRLPDPERRELFQPDTIENGPGGHYSPKGNRFVAEAIAARLTKLGMIPPEACSKR